MEGTVVYTASTGRCGTLYMARMLEVIENCKITHEPLQEFGIRGQKLFIDGIARAANNGWNLNGIKRVCEFTKDGKVYFESDLIFLQCTYYFATRDINHSNIKIIELSRNKELVVKSICRKGIFYRNNRGKMHLGRVMHPYGKTNILVLSKDALHLEIGVWYIFEIEERKKLFRKKFPNIQIFSFNMDKDPPDLSKWYELVEFLGLKMNRGLRNKIIENPIINPSKPNPKYIEYSLEECQEAIDDYKFIINQSSKPRGYL